MIIFGSINACNNVISRRLLILRFSKYFPPSIKKSYDHVSFDSIYQQIVRVEMQLMLHDRVLNS